MSKNTAMNHLIRALGRSNMIGTDIAGADAEDVGGIDFEQDSSGVRFTFILSSHMLGKLRDVTGLLKVLKS